MKKSKYYLGALGIFLVLLALCTYISQQVYRKNLVSVKAENEITSHLNFTYAAEGIVSYDRIETVSLPSSCLIEEVFLNSEAMVKSGDALCSVTLIDGENELRKAESQKQEIEGKLSSLDEGVEKEFYQEQLSGLTGQIERIKTAMQEDGKIFSGVNGRIVSIVSKGMQIGAGQTLVTIANQESDLKIQFSLPGNAKYIAKGIPVEVTVVNQGQDSTYDFLLTDCQYRQKDNTYQCEITVPTETVLEMNPVHEQKVFIQVKSSSSEQYSSILPISAVTKVDSGNVMFYVLRERDTIHGHEYYVVETSSAILDENEEFIAISSPVNAPVVTFADGDLSDGQAVKVITE